VTDHLSYDPDSDTPLRPLGAVAAAALVRELLGRHWGFDLVLLLGSSGTGKSWAQELCDDDPRVISWNGPETTRRRPDGRLAYIVLNHHGAQAYPDMPEEWVAICRGCGLHRSWCDGAPT
jgi:hypothetical protein